MPAGIWLKFLAIRGPVPWSVDDALVNLYFAFFFHLTFVQIELPRDDETPLSVLPLSGGLANFHSFFLSLCLLYFFFQLIIQKKYPNFVTVYLSISKSNVHSRFISDPAYAEHY